MSGVVVVDGAGEGVGDEELLLAGLVLADVDRSSIVPVLCRRERWLDWAQLWKLGEGERVGGRCAERLCGLGGRGL